MPFWRSKLEKYEDSIVCDFLEFGFSLDVSKDCKLSFGGRRNQKEARDYSEFIDKYLIKECRANWLAGPFNSNPFANEYSTEVELLPTCLGLLELL